MTDEILTLADDDSAGHTLEAYWAEGDLHLSIDNPWAGDSETGFGYTTHIRLTPESVAALLAWLEQKS